MGARVQDIDSRVTCGGGTKEYRGVPSRQPTVDYETLSIEEQKEAIIHAVEEQPEITLEEIIKKLNLPIKKSRGSTILLEEKMFFKKEAGSRKRTKKT